MSDADKPDGEEGAKAFLKHLNAQSNKEKLESIRDSTLQAVVDAGAREGYIFDREDLRRIAHNGILVLEIWNDL